MKNKVVKLNKKASKDAALERHDFTLYRSVRTPYSEEFIIQEARNDNIIGTFIVHFLEDQFKGTLLITHDSLSDEDIEALVVYLHDDLNGSTEFYFEIDVYYSDHYISFGNLHVEVPE